MTIACPDCGTLEDLPQLKPGAAALCPSCYAALERTSGRSVTAALACSAATFLLLFPANLLPLMQVTILGMSRESRIWSGVMQLWSHQWVILALLVGLFAVILPFLRFGLLTIVLACVRAGWQPGWLGRAFRWAMRLDAWAMPDVFLIGCVVGYSRINANMPVRIEAGGYCFIAAALLCAITRAAMERRTVWRSIAPEQETPSGPVISCTVCDLIAPATAEGEPCPRCGLRLHARKTDAMIRTTALVAAGFLLYLPANIYPMSSNTQLGGLVTHRIIDGIRELFQAGLWPFGILIFCTSIAIPLVKLLGLSWFVLSARRRSGKRLVLKTKLYRFIDEIGRWSNVDVFTVAVFVPLLQFGIITQTRAEVGSTAFVLVVLLTMLASRAFDPRLLWDAAEQTP
ncbi:MAG TPA: paraquat-inducible protein A [Rhizomicrobium sp.]|nr:paraquat-inducible protein A [Rhizomicrobium sp.]